MPVAPPERRAPCATERRTRPPCRGGARAYRLRCASTPVARRRRARQSRAEWVSSLRFLYIQKRGVAHATGDEGAAGEIAFVGRAVGSRRIRRRGPGAGRGACGRRGWRRERTGGGCTHRRRRQQAVDRVGDGHGGGLAPLWPSVRHRDAGAGRHPVDGQAGHAGSAVRPGAEPAVHRALLHLDAPDRRRQRRSDRFGRAAQPRLRSDPGAGERQAPPHHGSGEPLRRAQSRRDGHRPQHHPAAGHRSRGDPARRCRCAVRLRRHCRRDEHRAQAQRRVRKRAGLRPVLARRRRE